MKIEYFVDTGLYTNIIFVMLRAREVAEFIARLSGSVFLEFDAIDGADVRLSDSAVGSFGVCLALSEDVKSDLIRKCEYLSKENRPCHDYVDIDAVYSVMISKDEYF
ncbi:hypothetical protein ASD21_15960 [Caulobacter sp. Root1455]|uniref:hypothetical protein n=1 Tax=unclassified Caulobacter TaxID=2648921 RepID=UPI0006FF5780|nr:MULTISPECIES: hypothetical protein [unclassified Caulobacter]KQY28297.1 hypothetical protein ASD38_16570 [Caulobacter sp. Root487D2Y]KQY91804.1 hypothetical protein ASD21_15960 [Caulobacter sp. Root1455]